MNQHTFYNPSSVDAQRVLGFSMTDPQQKANILNAWQLSFDDTQYAYWQNKFLYVAKKPPTVGELILLDAMCASVPMAQKIACGELYCNSPMIMDTWNRVVGTYDALHGDTSPVSLQDILHLPKEALVESNQLSADEVLPHFAPSDQVNSISKHITPVATVTSMLTASARLLYEVKTSSLLKLKQGQTTPPIDSKPQMGDALVVVPRVDKKDILAFLQNHLSAQYMSDYRLVSGNSLLGQALTLCPQAGLHIQLDTFLRPVNNAGQSRMRMYVEACERPLPQTLCHVIFRIRSNLLQPVIRELGKYGFTAFHYGTVTKEPQVLIRDRNDFVVQLSADMFTSLVAPRLHTYYLPDPTPPTPQPLTTPTVTALPDYGLVLAETAWHLDNPKADGMGVAMQGFVEAMGVLSCRGISYRHVHVSPVISYTGEPHDPLLFSTLLGLYRMASELGLPIEHDHVNILPAIDDKHMLSVSLFAYAPMTKSPNTDAAVERAEEPLLDWGTAWDFEHIRKMLCQMEEGSYMPWESGHTVQPIIYPTLQDLEQKVLANRNEEVNL